MKTFLFVNAILTALNIFIIIYAYSLSFFPAKWKKKIKQDTFYWITWLILVILWNFGYPSAKPIYDVLVAVVLSIIFILIKKIK